MQLDFAADVRARIVASLAASALALAAQVPFFRVADAPIPVSLIAANGAAILLYCVVTAIITRKSLAAWAAILLVSPAAFALVPRIGSRAGSLTLVVIFAIVIVGSSIMARLMRSGAAPLVAAPIGSFLGAALLWFQLEHFRGVSNIDLATVAVLGLVGLSGAAIVVGAGRVAALSRLPSTGTSLVVVAFALSPAFLAGFVEIEKIESLTPAGVRAGTSAPPPVVLIVLDTVRADHLAAYGYSRDTMPALENFFREYGLPPLRSVANAPWSLPTHASIFTGLYPPRHGAHMGFLDDPDQTINFLPLPELTAAGEEMPTLASTLTDAGYWTVAIAGNYGCLSPSYGLARGFHEYTAEKDSLHSMRERTPWRLATDTQWHAAALSHIPPFSALNFFGPDVPYRRADQITDSAIQVIDDVEDSALFLFLNYLDAHSPYFPPPPYTNYFAGVQDDMPVPIEQQYYQHIAYTENRAAAQHEIDHVTALYDGELRFLDAQLERLFTHLKRHPRFEEMLIIVTSDHGEALGEHGDYGHDVSLYRDQLEVPLFIKLGSGGPEGLPADAMQSVDLFPLVLAHAGVEAPAGIDGLAWGEQRSEMLSWLYVYRHGVEHFGERFNRELRSVETAGFKLIESTNESPKLFEVLGDPSELEDLAGRKAEQVATMRATLGPRIGYAEAGGGPRAQPSEETLDALRALGYIE